MEYAKVRYWLPKWIDIQKVDIEQDELLYGVFKDDQLIVDRNAELSRDLIQKLEDREVRKIWINRSHTRWVPVQEALENKFQILEKKTANPIQSQLLDQFDGVYRIEGLKKIVEAYEDLDLGDMVFSRIVSVKQQLDELAGREDELADQLEELEDEELRMRILEIMGAKNPEFDPEEYPAEVQSLIKDFMEFVGDLRDARREIVDVVLDVEEEKTPDVDLNDDEKQSPLKETKRTQAEDIVEADNPLVESTDFASELFESIRKDQAPDNVKEFYEKCHEWVHEVLFKGKYSKDDLEKVCTTFHELLERFPDPFWLLPEQTFSHDDMLGRGICRLVSYAQVWTDDVRNEDKLRRIIVACLLCDVGMVNIPEIHWLHEDELEEYQKTEVEKHPAKSSELLGKLDEVDEQVRNWIHQHQERGNELGYPEGSDLNNWEPEAQKLAMCDVFDALTSERPWRNSLAVHEALARLTREFREGDRDLLKEFNRGIGRYPSGSLVHIPDWEKFAIVERQTDDSKNPRIQLLETKNNKVEVAGQSVDLRNENLKVSSDISDRVASWPVREKCHRELATKPA